MRIKSGFGAVAILSILALSACGGGGGSDSSSDSSSGSGANKLVLPQDGSVQFDGEAVTAGFSTGAGGSITINDVNAPEGSTLRLTTENDDIVAARIIAPNSRDSFDSREDDDLTRTRAAVAFDSPDRDEGTLLIDPSKSRFEYQTFGVWLEGRRGPTGVAGAGSYGSRTPTRDMPNSGRASYEGISTGVARLSDGNPYLTASEVRVTTDFRTATITSSDTAAVSLVDDTERTARELDFSGTGDVNGNRFSADVSGTDTSGKANGLFYGPRANEVGGTFRTSGPGGVSHIGSFGADR